MTVEQISPTSPIAHIAYGKTRVPLAMDETRADWHVITPRQEAALPNAHEAFLRAATQPINSRPLRDVARPGQKVVIVTSDGTRPVPNKLLIPWILSETGVRDEDVTVLLGTGTHRPNTDDEIEAMFGADLVHRLDIINHNCFVPEQNTSVGTTSRGVTALLNRQYVEADVRICLGFIEPHLFAGFSGGAKGIMPGIAGIDSILQFHSFAMVAHPESGYGKLDHNPVQQMLHEVVSFCSPDFLVNVTLNTDKQITGFFLGDYVTAHRTGCEHVRNSSMVAVEERYPIIVTSNSGYPLDQNMYQSAKAVAVAEPIMADGGTIFLVSECSDGLPSHGNFGSLLARGLSATEMHEALRTSPTELDQWQVQVLLRAALRGKIVTLSSLTPEQMQLCYLHPASDLQTAVEAEIERRMEQTGTRPRVAVLPDGPLTIPYLRA